MKSNRLIVSRHPAAIEFVRQVPGWVDAELIEGNATVADVAGREVTGPLPLQLIAKCARYFAIEFASDAPRGQEFSLAEMQAAGARLVEYRVTAVPVVPPEMEWNNRQKSRDRKAFCLLLKGGDIYNFDGRSIPGIVHAREIEHKKDGKWSYTTFAMRLAQGVRAITGHSGWETGTLAEGIAVAIGQSDWSLAALSTGLHVSPAALCALAERSSGKTLRMWLAELDDACQKTAEPPVALTADSAMADALRRAGLL